MARIPVNKTDAPILTCFIFSESGHLSKTGLLTPEQLINKNTKMIKKF